MVDNINKLPVSHTKFKIGDIVKKTKGSEWLGYIVGWYSTELTAEGYAVESLHHRGSVQIYPANALERIYYSTTNTTPYQVIL